LFVGFGIIAEGGGVRGRDAGTRPPRLRYRHGRVIEAHRVRGNAMTKVVSEVAGNVWKVEVQVGQAVTADETLMVIESMKMEIPVEAPHSGTVMELRVNQGDPVEEGTVLVVLD
jgi:acetyl-CoA carboxylase biotin carboxyl carrier protein